MTIFADGEVDRSPMRIGDVGALRAAGRRRRCSATADVLRHDSIVGTTFLARVVGDDRRRACSPRSRGWRTARASTASCSTRATRWAPASSCDEPAASSPRPTSAERLRPTAAIDALEAALRAGLDPEADPPRGALAVGGGELLVMPSAAGGHAVVKLVTVGGEPRIQGVCVVFDAATLAPVALVDGDRAHQRCARRRSRRSRSAALAAPDARRLLVFGRGPQAHGHVEAIRAVRPIEHVDMVGRDGRGVDELVAAADVICCATTAREPLFDGVARGRPRDGRRHRLPRARGARDRRRARRARATVVVESRASALREAGDVIAAIAAGALARGRAGDAGGSGVRRARRCPPRPRLFKSTGMAWEDAVVASALVR